VAGTWRDTDQQVLNTTTGTPVLFTGSGGMLIASPNGTYTQSYDNVVFTANSGGVHWTATLNGTESGDWAVSGGQLLISNVSSGVTDVVTEDGVYAGTSRLTVSPVDAGYTCSGNTFTLTFPQGGSDHFTRVSSLSRRTLSLDFTRCLDGLRDLVDVPAARYRVPSPDVEELPNARLGGGIAHNSSEEPAVLAGTERGGPCGDQAVANPPVTCQVVLATD
jgi:hypothetical protein